MFVIGTSAIHVVNCTIPQSILSEVAKGGNARTLNPKLPGRDHHADGIADLLMQELEPFIHLLKRTGYAVTEYA